MDSVGFMRGTDTKQASMYCLMSPESVVPAGHPIRAIKKLTDEVLAGLSVTFDQMYAATGRPSIPPERLLKATVLMALYTVRSERQFCEQLNYNLLFRWFVDMDMAEPGWDHSTFSRNRERLLRHDVASKFFYAVVEQARAARLMSTEHFTVDGTLIEAWASAKSFKAKSSGGDGGPPDDPGNPTVSFRGEKRSNETHVSSTDPESRLARKGDGKEAKLSYSAHALMENRHGLLTDFRVDQADGRAECRNAFAMLQGVARGRRITVGADKLYDNVPFVTACRQIGATPHIAANVNRAGGSALDARTTGTPGYAISQRIRKRVEEIFGWAKTVGGFRKTRFVGLARTRLAGFMVAAAYNLIRVAKLRPLLEPA
jgi:transposase